jgi:hypothetical protein
MRKHSVPSTQSGANQIIDLTLSPSNNVLKQEDTAGNRLSDSETDSDVEVVIEPVQQHNVNLSEEQKLVLRHIQNGHSVFFTGSAGEIDRWHSDPGALLIALPGTGKSVLLREIIKYFDTVYESSKQLAITASTGIASVNIGGVTLHSWAGIGLGEEDALKYALKFLGQPKFDRVLKRWQGLRTLIVDESESITHCYISWYS